MERTTCVYRTVAGMDLEMDLYRPEKAAGLRPGILFIHGGGWSNGTRTSFAGHAEWFAAAGYVTATVSYRLSGTAPYPAALEDCQAAVRWLRAQAARFGLDPDRLASFGASAGGHLAASLGLRETRGEGGALGGGAISSRVQAVVDLFGVHDFPSLTEDRPNRVQFLGGPFAEKPEVWREASPLAHVDGRAAPMLLVHDPGDPIVPFSQSVDLAVALMRAGRPVQVLPTPGSGHGFGRTWKEPVMAHARAWLNQWLGPVG